MAKNSERTILVTGATGQQGAAAYRHLQKRGFKLRALVRDPGSEKARQLVGHGEEVIHGDLNDQDSLSRAMDGVYGVFSVQPYTDDVATEVKQGKALIEAALRQEISHFVYSSVVAADEQTGIAHFESKGQVEDHLRSSGLRYTIFQPVFFMENWQTMMAEPIRNGQIPLPLSPTTKLQMIAVDDIGAFTALAFEHPDKWKNRTFALAGDELSMQGIAEAFSRVSANPVRYVQVPWDQFEQQTGHELTVMYRWFESHGYHVDLSAVKDAYPHVTSFNRWLETHWSVAKTAAS
jgi:uncharacterized protein YbjT (DUF2867 family)